MDSIEKAMFGRSLAPSPPAVARPANARARRRRASRAASHQGSRRAGNRGLNTPDRGFRRSCKINRS